MIVINSCSWPDQGAAGRAQRQAPHRDRDSQPGYHRAGHPPPSTFCNGRLDHYDPTGLWDDQSDRYDCTGLWDDQLDHHDPTGLWDGHVRPS